MSVRAAGFQQCGMLPVTGHPSNVTLFVCGCGVFCVVPAAQARAAAQEAKARGRPRCCCCCCHQGGEAGAGLMPVGPQSPVLCIA